MQWKRLEEKTQMCRQLADTFKRLHPSDERQHEVPTFETSLFHKHLPSDNIIFCCKFMQDEQYHREITSIDTGEELSFDHTFKVAANIIEYVSTL